MQSQYQMYRLWLDIDGMWKGDRRQRGHDDGKGCAGSHDEVHAAEHAIVVIVIIVVCYAGLVRGLCRGEYKIVRKDEQNGMAVHMHVRNLPDNRGE